MPCQLWLYCILDSMAFQSRCISTIIFEAAFSFVDRQLMREPVEGFALKARFPSMWLGLSGHSMFSFVLRMFQCMMAAGEGAC